MYNIKSLRLCCNIQFCIWNMLVLFSNLEIRSDIEMKTFRNKAWCYRCFVFRGRPPVTYSRLQLWPCQCEIPASQRVPKLNVWFIIDIRCATQCEMYECNIDFLLMSSQYLCLRRIFSSLNILIIVAGQFIFFWCYEISGALSTNYESRPWFNNAISARLQLFRKEIQQILFAKIAGNFF